MTVMRREREFALLVPRWSSGTTSNEEYIASFEAGTITADSFHHADHVRLAFAYLDKFSVLDALGRLCVALERFAAAQGKPERYHETITYAYFFLVNERKAKGHFKDWEQFARDNPDLLRREDRILNRYYEQVTLDSDLARRVFVFPDKFERA